MESNIGNNLVNEQPLLNTMQPKSLISSLLFTPTIRKSAIFANNELKYADKNVWHGVGGSNCGGGNGGVSGGTITEQQNMFKESITKNFQENLYNLERSKVQTQNVIDNLRTNLSEIEILTANNIFKITSMNQQD